MRRILDNRIKLIFGNEEVVVTLNDNPTSRDLVEQLPLILTFKDFAGVEKIAYTPKKLSIQDAPSSSKPSVGDLTLYIPWGNLAIFYKDKNYSYSSDIIILGHIESGIEKLRSINNDFIVIIEKVV